MRGSRRIRVRLSYQQIKGIGVPLLAATWFGLQAMWLIQSPVWLVLVLCSASAALSVGWTRFQRRMEERRDLAERVSCLRVVAPGTRWTL